jgi:outer membrane lipoprotein-sorting protein
MEAVMNRGLGVERKKLGSIFLLIGLLANVAFAQGKDSPEFLLTQFDRIMGSETLEATATMKSIREDGTERSYDMTLLKKGNNKFRVTFSKPASVTGQEILRVDEDSWLYLPKLKRTTRIANRESFQGGDFNNADILRASYVQDYAPQWLPANTSPSEEWKDKSMEKSLKKLLLTSRSENSSYAKVHLWLESYGMPLRAEFFGSSGKHLRTAIYLQPEKLDGKVLRPTLIEMQNEVAKMRKSNLKYHTLKTELSLDGRKFAASDLGK